MTSSINTIADLYTEIVRLLDGDDPDITDLSTDTLARLLTVAQKRIYREVRSRWNEKEFTSLFVTGNLATLPSDFESHSICHFGKQALIPVDEDVIRDYWSQHGGQEKYFAVAGSSFTFWPPIDDGTELQGRYYARLPDLTDDNLTLNDLFQNADDLFVYAALVESAPFFGQAAQMQTWESKYESIVEALNLHNHRSAYSAGRLRRRPSAAICQTGRRSA
jgi:hypothetical protein